MANPSTPDVFDQVSVGQQPQQTDQSQQPQQTQVSSTQGGDIFDQVASGAVPSSPSSAVQPQTIQPSITATPEPTSVGGKVERWARNVSEDLKYGTDLTGIGTVLKKMGAHGVYSGNPEAVGDFMGSLPLGLSKAHDRHGRSCSVWQACTRC
jgi:hypothetical protein